MNGTRACSTISADDLLSGVLDLTVAAPLALGSFVSVSAVEWSEGVRTACVECAHRPRLLLNPDFVKERCTTRERLAMLLLHELSHISLGHTRLYPRPTVLHNLAFDAVINARLVHSLQAGGIDPGPYTALLESCYAPDEVPMFLLRPAPGWPRSDWDAAAEAPTALRSVHRRLYDAAEAERVTYTEILLALREWAADNPDGVDGEALANRLLGGHGRTPEETAALSGGRDNAAAELLHPTLSALGLEGEAAGARRSASLIEIDGHRAERRLQQALEKLLRRVLTDEAGRSGRHSSVRTPVLSVDPSRDRRAAGRGLLARRFSAPKPLLFSSSVDERRPDRAAAVVYVDVSGSMGDWIQRLHGALVPLRRLLTADVFAFSGAVDSTPLGQFVAGSVPTSWGTAIDPVLEHAVDLASRTHAPPRRALVLTDGWFTAPARPLAERLRSTGMELHVAVAGNGPIPEGAWVTSATRLPSTYTPRDPRR